MEGIPLEAEPGSVTFKPLSHEPDHISKANERILPRSGDDRTLLDAIDDFRGILCPGGQGDGEEGYLDRSEQIQIIEREASRLGILYDSLEPAKEGGREHDLTFDQATGTVLKFTKPSSAAFVVEFLDGKPHLCNGDPLEYLERLQLHNGV